MWNRLKLFLTPFDARFEDMTRANWRSVVWRDLSAGLIVAMMAIPMAMGFAISAGLRLEHGIVTGAISGIVLGLFGGTNLAGRFLVRKNRSCPATIGFRPTSRRRRRLWY